jgi:chromosome segregation ATPase
MLLYEHEGFIEADTKEIQQLCRSPFAVSFGSDAQNKYELQASLCDYQDKNERRCRVALYAKSLKKALIFTVAGTDKKALWKYGQETLLELGFQLEDVNLKLSPAMLEVVLRDVPGIASPAEAQLHRSEHKKMLADLQATCDEKPESPQGKRAALKLSTEKHLQERVGGLRELLEALFSPEEVATDEMATLLAQIKDLTARLEEAERSQKEISEVITTAAEKRIQELEEILVDVETQSSDVLKQKRKVVALNGRIKELDSELVSAREVLAEEQENQKQFVDDVKSANEQIVSLQKDLKESEDLREEAFAQLGEQESEATQLDKTCREAELRIKVLDQELKVAEQRADGFSEAVKLSDELQVQLDKVEEQFNKTITLKDSLKEELATAVEKQETLQKSLEEAESFGQANAAKHAELQESEHRCAELGQENEGLKEELSLVLEKHDDLQKSLEEAKSLSQANTVEYAEIQETEGRCAELVKMNESLREEFDHERSVRKLLERGASEDDRRISELDQSLKQAESAADELKSGSGGAMPESSAALDQEMKALALRFDQEKAARVALDNELLESHEIIDSLEKMVRETEASGLEMSSRKASTEQDNDRVHELEERLRSLEDQLQGETLVNKTLAKELASVEKKLAEQEDLLAVASTVKKGQGVVETAAPVESEKMSKASKPLPHEVRPAPKKGAFFRPDWALQGLPCRSTGQVFKAWETVFNVQMAIEGYTSQYCMAFMVVLKLGKQKHLYLLYRLKQDKHTLICVPAKSPKNEASLQKAIKEGLDFLRKSGFEMDEMSAEHIESSLGAYCLESD